MIEQTKAFNMMAERAKHARYQERLVVEEAHVVGQWKLDFREDYQRLSELRSLATVPWGQLCFQWSQQIGAHGS